MKTGSGTRLEVLTKFLKILEPKCRFFQIKKKLEPRPEVLLNSKNQTTLKLGT